MRNHRAEVAANAFPIHQALPPQERKRWTKKTHAGIRACPLILETFSAAILSFLKGFICFHFMCVRIWPVHMSAYHVWAL